MRTRRQLRQENDLAYTQVAYWKKEYEREVTRKKPQENTDYHSWDMVTRLTDELDGVHAYIDNLRELGYKLPSTNEAKLAVEYHRLQDAATKVDDLIHEGPDAS